MRLPAYATLCAIFFLAPANAWAGDKEQAESLFKAGRALLEAGELDAACTTLQRSLELRYGMATEFHLADCEERRRHFTAAALHFRNIARVAEGKGDAVRARASTTRALAADARTAHVTFSGALVPGEQLVFDGVPLDRALPVTTTVDAGTHTLRATADGYRPHEATVVTAAGVDVSVTIPPLSADAPPPAPAPPAPPPAAPEVHRRSLVPWVTATGVAVLGTGAAIAYYVNRDGAYGDCRAAIDAGALCTNESSLATGRKLAVGGIVVGSAAVATFLAITLWEGRDRGARVGCAPERNGVGCAVVGAF